MAEEYLTVKDVAAMLKVTDRTVARWIELGRIRPSRIGRTVRFKRSLLLMQLDDWERGVVKKHDPLLG